MLLKKPMDDLKDGDQLEGWLINLRNHQVTIHVESGDPFVDALGDSPIAFLRISVTELSELVDASKHLIRF